MIIFFRNYEGRATSLLPSVQFSYHGCSDYCLLFLRFEFSSPSMLWNHNFVPCEIYFLMICGCLTYYYIFWITICNFRYMLFWLVIFGAKFSFAYFLLVTHWLTFRHVNLWTYMCLLCFYTDWTIGFTNKNYCGFRGHTIFMAWLCIQK